MSTDTVWCLGCDDYHPPGAHTPAPLAIPPVIAKTYADVEGTYASLPTEAKARKAIPICTGVLDYFPDALAAVAEVSRLGNEQHNPGQPLHWARGKSTDQEDCLVRHLLERGTIDTDGSRHSAKLAWRALAILQLEIEAARGK